MVEHNRLPRSTANTKYPYNQVIVTESGHEIHLDNTPGAERIRIAHRTGTYVEIGPDGRKVEFTVGNHHQYDKGGVTLTVDENQDVKITGHQRLLVGGGSHIEVRGDANMVVGGSSHSVVGGNLHAAVAGNMYTGVHGNLSTNVRGNHHIIVHGDTTHETRGTHTIRAARLVTQEG